MHLSRYIHVLNPGELVEPQIREGIIRDPLKLQSFLQNYKWSSYLDFLGQGNYPSLLNKEIISGYFNSVGEYKNFSLSWKNGNFDLISEISLD